MSTLPALTSCAASQMKLATSTDPIKTIAIIIAAAINPIISHRSFKYLSRSVISNISEINYPLKGNAIQLKPLNGFS
jgi:hypothetical protein